MKCDNCGVVFSNFVADMSPIKYAEYGNAHFDLLCFFARDGGESGRACRWPWAAAAGRSFP